MAEKENDVRARLRDAALTLFRARGYERVTAAGIAAAAGVTERTFFRHFPDKREILFDREAIVRDALLAAIERVPAGSGPLATLLAAFRAFSPMLEANRDYAALREALIAATPALREREIAKIAALAEALAATLERRGYAALPAELAAQAGMAAFVHATRATLADPGIRYETRLDEAFAALSALLTTHS